MGREKITLAEIKVVHPFEHTEIADLAEVNPIVIDWMLSRQPVTKWQAVEVLKVLSLVTGEDYTLNTVDVVLRYRRCNGESWKTKNHKRRNRIILRL